MQKESKAKKQPSLPLVERYFTTSSGSDPFEEIQWERRKAVISGENGETVFEQADVEVPASWSALATNVVASKYFRGTPGTPERENSVRTLISRVVDTIADWGMKGRYFNDKNEKEIFRAELAHLLLRQKAAFNSPVWFNVGAEKNPQCSACFINSVEDSMDSILTLAKTEGMLFKYGSGTGSNLSTLRSAREGLSGGGIASGPVSFMKGFDAFAGVIKSGGKTRRAAKMVILNADHPDILEFIRCKAKEEQKAHALIDAGYDGSFNGEAYSSIFFQNSNNSVRVTDEIMNAVKENGTWKTKAIRDGSEMDTIYAKNMFREIARAAYSCGDPGLQFDTTINSWHTCPNTARINASNPCSEYMFLDDSACNLASLNLMQFRTMEGEFNVEAFKRAVDIVLLAQEIIVGFSSYPTKKIEINSHKFRPLGLGYANLGALLMAAGLPYDSEEGRNYAAAITSLMCGEAYLMSAKMAQKMGPFEGYAENAEPMLKVMDKHRAAAFQSPIKGLSSGLLYESHRSAWNQAIIIGSEYGFRNSQVTVLAPTGTIGFMMDCDTTGIEPDLALIKYKKLVGGGVMKITNNSVSLALKKLGYDVLSAATIEDHLRDTETIEDAPYLRSEHLPVFDCALRPKNGKRSIHWMGHLRMMGACQPFLSGAISKTVNMPNDATVEDIELAYMEAWKLGLKAIAVYRDGCKRSQPLNTSKDKESVKLKPEVRHLERRKLPDERNSITHKFSIAGHEGYLTVGMYEDGTPGELFCVMAKMGSTVSGLMDGFATSISLALQYGVPLKVLVDKFSHTRFEPSGFTGNENIRIAKSITDYIFRWLEMKFLNQTGETVKQVENTEKKPLAKKLDSGPVIQSDAPPCQTCGEIMTRNGSCYKCGNCGGTSGCS